MRFDVLGPIRVHRATGEVVIAGSMARTVLATLLCRAGEVVPIAVLEDALWPGAPDAGAPRKLQVHMSKLRRAFGEPDRIVFEQDSYRLRVGPGELDAERFESLLDAAAATDDPATCVDRSREALELWKGAPYGGIDTPLLVDEGRRLEERRLAALEVLFQAELDQGRAAAVVSELMPLAQQHPLRERFHALLMTALYRAGRQADALRVFRNARTVLAEELGIEPGVELRALERTVLSGEPIDEPAQPTSRTDARSTPAQLPPDTRGFVAREREIAGLDLLLAGPDRWPVAALTGTAGVGKTALAVHWAHRVRDRFPDGQLYIDLRGFAPEPPVSASDALGSLLRALGVAPTAIPLDVAERTALYRSLLADRRVLVVLDNARDTEHARPLLPGSASCAVVITSRDALAGLVAREGVQRIDLDVLTVDDSRRLLRAVLGRSLVADATATATIIARCAQLPLALRLAAEQISLQAGADVATWASALDSDHDALTVLEVDGDPHAAVRATLSWSYDTLPPGAARLFRLVGLYPGHDPSLHALAALAGEPTRATRRSASTLVRAHLVIESESGRFRVHDLLRKYATELVHAIDDDSERNEALTRVYDYALAAAAEVSGVISPAHLALQPRPPAVTSEVPQFADYGAAVRWLDGECSELVDIALHAAARRRSEVPIQLATLLYPLLDGHGQPGVEFRLYTAALDAATELNDVVAEAHVTRYLAAAHRRAWNFDLALALGERAWRIYHDAGEVEYERRQLVNLAGFAETAGRPRDALAYCQQALALFEEADSSTVHLLATTRLGHQLTKVGRFDEAADRLENVLRSAGSNDSVMLEARVGIGHLRRLQGRHREAIEQYEVVRDHAIETGNLIPLENVTALGLSYHAVGRRDDAYAVVQQSMDACRRMTGHVPSNVRIVLGTLRLRDGDPEAAEQEFRQALQFARRTGQRLDAAGASEGLGDVAAERGDVRAAQRYWSEALGGFQHSFTTHDISRLESKLADAHDPVGDPD